MSETLLEIKDLKVYFFTEGCAISCSGKGMVKAVDGVNITLNKGEILGLVGESGCGKSVTALSLLKLLPPQARIVGGEIIFKGKDIVNLSEPQMREIRGGSISMIFQDPVTSLNPVFTIGNQICEAIKLHQGVSSSKAREKAIEMLKLVALSSPEEQLSRYPHQLSRGMNQRVMIAMALSTNPSLLIADEPTTALDVTTQSQILELLKDIQRDITINMSILFITHDLSIIAQESHRVCIMYAGRVVEEVKTEILFNRRGNTPCHPYTKGLLNSIPNIDNPNKRLSAIPGTVPNPLEPIPYCSFHPRCTEAMDICKQKAPEMKTIGLDHKIRCWKV